jgi:signal transduction histidine kinase
MTAPRPLDRIGSIKLKLGILVAASVAAASSLTVLGLFVGLLPRFTIPAAVVVALVVTQLLARGMTSPLREMTTATRQMATGDYSRRVTATSNDEVGELARAFNTMAADLEAVDQQRRDLVANVSHELRTPVSALRAVLENLVDGVARPDQATLQTALDQTERLGGLVTDLLDLSRLDAGIVPLQRETLVLRPFLDEAVAEARLSGRPRAVRRPRRPGRSHGARRPVPAAPARREPPRQREQAQPGRRDRHGRRAPVSRRHGRLGGPRGERRGSGHLPR